MSAAAVPHGTHPVPGTGPAGGHGRRRWLILGVIALAQLMVVLDSSMQL